MKNFDKHWKDGLAICALANKIDNMVYDQCFKADALGRKTIALEIFNKADIENWGLEPDELEIDAKSTWMYLSEIYHYFH